MSSGAANIESAEAAVANFPAMKKGVVDDVEQDNKARAQVSDKEALNEVLVGPNGEQYPTSEELKTLRRTHGHVPWLLYTIAFVELCERFAYYGTTVVCRSSRRVDGALSMLTQYSCQLHQLATASRIQDRFSRD
jgi:POT family proton-dependent oligopeptide transporter